MQDLPIKISVTPRLQVLIGNEFCLLKMMVVNCGQILKGNDV
jgi:hypothetical protein